MDAMNRQEQHERRRQIVRQVRDGQDRQQVANEHVVSMQTVDTLCRGIAPLPSELRRRAIARHVASGHDTAETAKKFGCSLYSVQTACQSQNVAYAAATVGPGSGRPSWLPVLADLLNNAGNLSQIAQQHHVSRQAVAQVRDRARAAGIRMPQSGANAQNSRPTGQGDSNAD